MAVAAAAAAAAAAALIGTRAGALAVQCKLQASCLALDLSLTAFLNESMVVCCVWEETMR